MIIYVWFIKRLIKKTTGALAGWLGGLEHHPMHQSFVGMIPSQGTYLGCKFNPQSGRGVQEVADQCFSFPLVFLSLPSTLSGINEHMD